MLAPESPLVVEPAAPPSGLPVTAAAAAWAGPPAAGPPHPPARVAARHTRESHCIGSASRTATAESVFGACGARGAACDRAGTRRRATARVDRRTRRHDVGIMVFLS